MTRTLEQAILSGSTVPKLATDKATEQWSAGLESNVQTGVIYTRTTWSVQRNKRNQPSRGCRTRTSRKQGSHLYSLRAHPTYRTW